MKPLIDWLSLKKLILSLKKRKATVSFSYNPHDTCSNI